MGEHALFINASHPDVVDRAALISAANVRLVGGIGLTAGDPELSGLDRIVVDPLPAPDDAARRGIVELVVDNVGRATEGRPVRSVLEFMTFPKAGDPSFWSSRMAPRATDL